MSAAMGLIYDSLTELMDACVKELLKSNRLDTSDLTAEQVGAWVDVGSPQSRWAVEAGWLAGWLGARCGAGAGWLAGWLGGDQALAPAAAWHGGRGSDCAGSGAGGGALCSAPASRLPPALLPPSAGTPPPALPPLQGLFRSFDEAVRRQLAPIWHTVSPKTRQIVADLRTLRRWGLLLACCRA